jgi:hypothetical protein
MKDVPGQLFTRRRAIAAAGIGSVALLMRPSLLFAGSGGDAGGIDPQPYFASVSRVAAELADAGAPLAPGDAERIALLAHRNDRASVEEAEAILGRYTLARVAISRAGPSHIGPGGAQRTLIEQGWRLFLVRVENPAARMDSFEIVQGGFQTPGQMMPGFSLAQRAFLMDTVNKAPLIEKMWLLAQLRSTVPIARYGKEIPVIALTGLPVEYHVMQVFSRDRGQRSANLTLSTYRADGSGASVSKKFEFSCLPTRDVLLAIKDADGRGCLASLAVTDDLGRVYPPQAMRLAPDMFFQRHVYRADGENLRLPDGDYTVVSRRGPEYLRGEQKVTIGGGDGRITVQLTRWIDPAKWGWYSGDTHLHAGGCAHYQVPTEGVSPETMIRHVRGEGLWVGDVLSWGPSWYYQKQFFTGHTVSPDAVLEHPELQAANNASLQVRSTPEDGESLLRYDVEVSGFPSSHAGHLVLLRLREQDYPATKLIEDWPSWNLPILKWAAGQGAVAGYAHCGSGMVVDSTELPNYDIPPMDGIGTQEAIVDVTHGVVDFLSGCDTRPAAELNAWYHMLNCGFRLAMIGETDYPCISGERPGVGRSYVRLDAPPAGDAGYDAWIRGLQQGRLYCGDGRSHFLDFKVQGRRSGEADARADAAGRVQVEATVAARLEPQPTPETEAIRNEPVPSWHIENARVGKTRSVRVELVVNGVAVDSAALAADGTPRQVRFSAVLSGSSWVALRIMPSSHTHPVFVLAGDKPIRASRRSARWCRACVDQIWEVKSPFMREAERPAAALAFDHARETYARLEKECLAE